MAVPFVGLTGGLGAGKSTALDALAELGAATLSTDTVVHELLATDELRELIVTGIVRPQDVARDNSVPHAKIAEARISYGGRGQISNAQQARWGQQIYDALFPF